VELRAVERIRRISGLGEPSGESARGSIRTPVAADLARVALAALYGAALGLWGGGEQALFAAAKLPIVLIVTWLLTVPCAALVGWTLGRRAPLAEIVAGTLAPLASAAVLLASLAPVAALFSATLPLPTHEARTEHNLLFLLHSILVGAAGVAGVARFRARIGVDLAPGRARAAVALWIGAYAFVGGQVAWSLRPFVGSVYEPVAFVRPNALEGNLYEFILFDIVPHLARTVFE
jgi:hypothetical protein